MGKTSPTELIKHGGAFKPYPAHKDSGVEWLGEIPAHWEVKRLTGGSPSRPLSGNPAGCPYHRICAKTILPATLRDHQFRPLEMILRENYQEISEIPPRPPLTKGGWGDFRGIHPYGNIAFLVPAGPG
jgi:hypothetical protein